MLKIDTMALSMAVRSLKSCSFLKFSTKFHRFRTRFATKWCQGKWSFGSAALRRASAAYPHSQGRCQRMLLGHFDQPHLKVSHNHIYHCIM